MMNLDLPNMDCEDEFEKVEEAVERAVTEEVVEQSPVEAWRLGYMNMFALWDIIVHKKSMR